MIDSTFSLPRIRGLRARHRRFSRAHFQYCWIVSLFHWSSTAFFTISDYEVNATRLSRPQPNRPRRNRARLNRPPPNDSDQFSEPESVFSTPPLFATHRSREAASPSRRSVTADRDLAPPSPTPQQRCSSRGSVPSPAPLQMLRTMSSPVSASPVPSRIPINSTPPTPTSILSYGSDHVQSVAGSSRVRSQGRAQSAVPPHRTQGPQPELAEAGQVDDPHGLRELAHLVKLQDPALRTKREIHFCKPGEQGLKGRWYIV
jgi:hypothetical protein